MKKPHPLIVIPLWGTFLLVALIWLEVILP